MAVELNHTIVASKDKVRSANDLAELLGLPEPTAFGPFHVVAVTNGVSLDFAHADQINPQHYAFLVSEDDFDAVLGRIQQRGLTYWAEPTGGGKGEINTRDGGRGLYWESPDGHYLEILTRPYGSGG